ncbi:MAG TPA: DUF4890 domain-containing protein [Flavipsychrobacter sp.]|nr:DUF4890 domain-containing protein [Flavipsychrobacter sp.]
MKKLVVIALAALSFNFYSAQAQDSKSAQKGDPKREVVLKTEKMVKELNLNDEQRAAVMELNIRMMDRERIEKADERQIEAERNVRLQAILTQEQYQKYSSGKKEGGQQEAPLHETDK